MSLFTNPNFIDQIIKSQGGEELIMQEQYVLLQTYIEIETRHCIESAIKYMHQDRKDIIDFEDVEQGAKDQMNGDLNIVELKGKYKDENGVIIKIDNVLDPYDVFKDELSKIDATVFDGPKLKGQWIYIKGEIPNSIENIHLKKLVQLHSIKQHEAEEKKKLFNIIKDQPTSLLTKQQNEFYEKVTEIISSDSSPNGGIPVNGDLTGLVPFFLKFFCHTTVNETGICFLLDLIENKYVWKCVDFYLRQILAVLMAYKGTHGFRVGIRLSALVERFYDKYPTLLDVFQNYQDDSYCSILKKIAFEIILGVAFQYSQKQLVKCIQETEQGNKMASLCLQKLSQHASQLKSMKKLIKDNFGTFIYWIPCKEMRGDRYLEGL